MLYCNWEFSLEHFYFLVWHVERISKNKQIVTIKIQDQIISRISSLLHTFSKIQMTFIVE